MALARDIGPTSLDEGVFPEFCQPSAAKAGGYLILSNLRSGGRNGKNAEALRCAQRCRKETGRASTINAKRAAQLFREAMGNGRYGLKL